MADQQKTSLAHCSDQTVTDIRDRARINFSKGYNCAECVLEAVLAKIDTRLPDTVLKMATGFGGGVGLFGDTCGAVTGAVLAVGAVHGREELPAEEDRKAAMKKAAAQLYGKPGLYRLFNQIPNQIKEKYGATCCRDIADKWKDEWLCRDHALHCREVITDAAELAARLICEDKTDASSRPFGANVENLRDNPADCEKKG